MAIEVFKLFGSIMVDNEKANDSIKKTGSEADSLGSKFLSGIGTVGKWGMAIGGAAVAGGAALLGMASKASETTDRIDKLSNKIGISKQGFQEWDYVLGQNGMDVEKLQVGVKTLTAQMDAANSGNKGAIESFNKLGLTWKDGSGNLKNQEEMMNESIMALAKMENGTEKARMATDLFGKAGMEMMPMLNNGAEGITQLKDRAHELGLVMSDESVSAGVLLGDTMDDVKNSFQAVATKIGVNVMPIVQKFLDFILDKMPLIQKVFGVVFSAIGNFVSLVGNSLTDAVSSINNKFGWIIDKVVQMKEAFTNSMDEFDDYGEAFKSMIEVVMGPVGDLPIFEEIGKIISAIREIIYRVKGGEGIGEAFQAAFEWRDSTVGNALLDLMGFCTTIFQSIESVIATVIQNLGPIFEGLKNLFSITMSALATAWESIGKPIWGYFVEVVQKVAEVFNIVWPIVANIFSGLCDTLNNLWVSILKPIFEAIGVVVQYVLLPIFSSSFNSIANAVMNAFRFIGDLWNNSLKPILDGIINFVGGVFSGNFTQAFRGIVEAVKGIFGGLVTVVKAPLNLVIGVVNKFINGLNRLKIPDWVPGVGGKGINIPDIPMLAKGTDYFSGSAYGNMALVGEQGPELVNLPTGSRVHTATETKDKLSQDEDNKPIQIFIDGKKVFEALSPYAAMATRGYR